MRKIYYFPIYILEDNYHQYSQSFSLSKATLLKLRGCLLVFWGLFWFGFGGFCEFGFFVVAGGFLSFRQKCQTTA